MNKKLTINFLLLLIGIFILEANLACAEHYIVGVVNNATDSTSANGRTVIIYYAGDEGNNDSDIIGPTGNSGVDNEYMCDAEAIPNHTWGPGDVIFAKVIDSGDGYTAGPVNVTTTGAGWDEEPNMTLTLVNTAPTVDYLILEDDDSLPADELDLSPGTTKLINCSGAVSDIDGAAKINNVFALLYDSVTSSPGAADNNTNHYTNSSCDTSVLDADTLNYNCLFNVQFYANPNLWNCNITVNDSSGAKDTKENSSTITELIAIDITVGNITFDNLQLGENTGTADQTEVITNAGNIPFDLNLEVYGSTYADGLAMICTNNESINASYERWSLIPNINYTLKNKSISDGAGTDITNFDLSKGASSTKNIYFGLGIQLTPIVKESCSGILILTAISDS